MKAREKNTEIGRDGPGDRKVDWELHRELDKEANGELERELGRWTDRQMERYR